MRVVRNSNVASDCAVVLILGGGVAVSFVQVLYETAFVRAFVVVNSVRWGSTRVVPLHKGRPSCFESDVGGGFANSQ